MASSLETGNLSLEAAGYEPGIKRYVRQYGVMEERTLIIDSEALLLWAGEAGESDDDMRLDGPFEIGDILLGGFVVVLDAGGESGAIADFGVENGTDTFLGDEINLDAAVGTAKAGLSVTTEAFNLVTTAESFVTCIVNTAAMITEEEPGRWQLTYYVLKGASANTTYEQYTGDPNVMPQVVVTAE